MEAKSVSLMHPCIFSSIPVLLCDYGLSVVITLHFSFDLTISLVDNPPLNFRYMELLRKLTFLDAHSLKQCSVIDH